MAITTIDEFNALVKSVESREDYRRPAAFAIGLASFSITDHDKPTVVGSGARILDTWYPVVNLKENFGAAAVLAQITGYSFGSAISYLSLDQLDQAIQCFAPFASDGKEHPNLRALQDLRAWMARYEKTADSQLLPRAVVVTFIGDLAAKPLNAHDVYLRLHLLSYRRVRPHGLNLDGVFGLLSNVAWTNLGPFDADNFERNRLRLRARGLEVTVNSVDKFPRLTDYVIPGGVRIADGARVRLGAFLAEGTTVMHEGFVNFNAGTLGKSMVEGRISAGVVVGAGSDIGGGASIMGTLSGGGKQVIKVGENCLLGANSGLGISLGKNCVVEAGLYVTAASKVKLPDGSVVKAAELNGKDGMLFRRNSQTGAIEVLARDPKAAPDWGGLNQQLHLTAGPPIQTGAAPAIAAAVAAQGGGAAAPVGTTAAATPTATPTPVPGGAAKPMV